MLGGANLKYFIWNSKGMKNAKGNQLNQSTLVPKDERKGLNTSYRRYKESARSQHSSANKSGERRNSKSSEKRKSIKAKNAKSNESFRNTNDSNHSSRYLCHPNYQSLPNAKCGDYSFPPPYRPPLADNSNQEGLQQIINIQTPSQVPDKENCLERELPPDRRYQYQFSEQPLNRIVNPLTTPYSPVLGGKSPQNIMKTNVLEQKMEKIFVPQQFPENWRLMLQKLELFWKDRVIKLRECLNSVVDHSCEDEVLKTMMENTETRVFAEQRLQEMLREGLQVEQELQIEQLSKQVIFNQSDLFKTQAQFEQLFKDFQRVQEEKNRALAENQDLKAKGDQLAKEVKKKYKGKLENALAQVEEQEQKWKEVQNKYELMVEQVKNNEMLSCKEQFEKQMNEKGEMRELNLKISECKDSIQQLEGKLNQQKVLTLQFEEDLNREKERNQKLKSQHEQQIQHAEYQHELDLQAEKEKFRKKLEEKVNQYEESVSNQIKQRENHIQEAAFQQIKEMARKEEDLRKSTSEKLHQISETHIEITNHEKIVNQELQRLTQAHENEIEMIKKAFEKELRKAEKLMKEASKKEESRLLKSIKEAEDGLESVAKEKEQQEYSMQMQLSYSQSEVSRLKVDNEHMERFYEEELGKVREVARQEIVNLKSKIGQLEEDIEGYHEEKGKQRELTASKNNDHERRMKELLDELQETEGKVKGLEKHCKGMEYQIEQKEYNLERVEGQLEQYKKMTGKQQEQSQGYVEEIDRLKSINEQLRRKLSDQARSTEWSFEKLLQLHKNLRQECEIMKKLISSDIDYTVKENQALINSQFLFLKRKLECQQDLNNRDKVGKEAFQTVQEQKRELEGKVQQLEHELHKSNLEKQQVERDLEELTKREQRTVAEMKRNWEEQVESLEMQVKQEREECDKGWQMMAEYSEQLEQLRNDNIGLQEKIGELEQYVQDLEFKKKELENELELSNQSYNTAEISHQQDMERLKTDFSLSQEQLVSDFQRQCEALKEEMHSQYEQRIEKKVSKLKEKHQEQLKSEEERFSKELRMKQIALEESQQVYSQRVEQLERELRLLKEKRKKSLEKLRQKNLKEQQNIQRIDEEVTRSLAKVFYHNGGNNLSSTRSRKTNNFTATDRSYQSIQPNNYSSLFSKARPHGQFHNSYLGHGYSNNINNSFTFPKSAKNTFDHQTGKLNANIQSFNDTNYSNPNDYSAYNKRVISPLAKSNDMSTLTNNSSFIMVNQSHNNIPFSMSKHIEVSKIDSDSQPNPLQENSVMNIVSATEEMGVGQNDSFLIARSLSPKEGTGMFGNRGMGSYRHSSNKKQL